MSLVTAVSETGFAAPEPFRAVLPKETTIATPPLPFELGCSSDAPVPAPFLDGRAADRLLTRAATAWWLVALAGQAIFTAYIGLLYGVSAWRGHFERWNEVVPRGWVAGHGAGNATLAGHLFFAAIVFASGGLQLVDAVRRRAPRLHRWNGRFYVVAALVLATSGVVLVAAGQSPGDPVQTAGTLLNVALIFAFAALAWRDALARRFERHRRWALRLLLAVAGVWFFRIGLMGWIVLNRGPVGFDPHTFRGPALSLLAFGQTLLPLAVLEAVFRARRKPGTAPRLAMAAVLVLASLLAIVGIAAATMLMWWPHMK